MAALWITQPLTRQARNLSCCFKLVTGAKGQLTQLTQDSLPATRFFVAFRAISTCNVLMQRRRKRFNHNPAGVPQWANYDGNQKCIDGGEFLVLFVADLVLTLYLTWKQCFLVWIPFTLSERHYARSTPKTKSIPFAGPSEDRLIWEGYKRNYKGGIPPEVSMQIKFKRTLSQIP